MHLSLDIFRGGKWVTVNILYVHCSLNVQHIRYYSFGNFFAATLIQQVSQFWADLGTSSVVAVITVTTVLNTKKYARGAQGSPPTVNIGSTPCARWAESDIR